MAYKYYTGQVIKFKSILLSFGIVIQNCIILTNLLI